MMNHSIQPPAKSALSLFFCPAFLPQLICFIIYICPNEYGHGGEFISRYSFQIMHMGLTHTSSNTSNLSSVSAI